MNIVINDKCIGCNKCIKLCPAKVFAKGDAKNKNKAVVENAKNCIECSHCVCVCPEKAIEHSAFPYETLRDIDFDKYPTPDQLTELIEGRRSNRSFTKTPIEKSIIDKLVKTVRFSPTASNTRNVECTVITNIRDLEYILRFTSLKFASIVDIIKNPILKFIIRTFAKNTYNKIIGLKKVVDEYESGNDVILRGATAIILFHAPKDSLFKQADCNIAYQNVSLLAESHQLAQFYTGYVCAAVERDKQKTLNAYFGIKGDICAGIALGNRAFPITRTRI